MPIVDDHEVSLRPIERRDLEMLNRWKNDEETYRYLGGGYAPTSVDIQEGWLESLMDMGGSSRRFIIEHSDIGSVGMIGLYDINWVHRTCDLGIFLGEKAARGHGVASRAYLLIEAYAHRYLNLRKIKASVVSDHASAVNMYERLGFRHAGALYAERFIDGAYRDLMLMEKFVDESNKVSQHA